jgi:hypothetical protein
MSTIYRGYEIALVDGKYVVTKDGKAVETTSSEDAAMSWVDAEKRRQAKK